MITARTMTRTLTDRLVDDAGLFPPEELAMPIALARHRSDEAAASPVLTHRFICPTVRFGELQAALLPDDHLDVIALGHPTADTFDAVRALATDGRVSIAALETTMPAHPSARTEAMHIVAAMKQCWPGLPVFVEVHLHLDLDHQLDLIAARGEAAKVRCGGVRPDLFPTVSDLARFVQLAADRALPFKATAGLHHAVGYRDPDTGFEHFGFLNLLAAVLTACDGATISDIENALAQRNSRALRQRIATAGPDTARDVRSIFRSIGSCSTSDPLEDLAALGLLAD